MDFVIAYVTAKDREQAIAIGRALVEERLAACVNVIGGVTSIYRWEGEIHTDDEAVLIAKTSAKKFSALSVRVNQLHTYTCPCVVSIPIKDGSAKYLSWLLREIDTE